MVMKSESEGMADLSNRSSIDCLPFSSLYCIISNEYIGKQLIIKESYFDRTGPHPLALSAVFERIGLGLGEIGAGAREEVTGLAQIYPIA